MGNKLPSEHFNEKIIIKKESMPGDYGHNPYERKAEELINFGVVNINKPQGPSSHQVSYYVKKILDIKHCGHSGTLDPNVTGVLPIALGKATRIVQTLLPAGKEYVCLMRLHSDVDEKDIRKKVDNFIGRIKQLPPVKSAIKRQLREREIYYFDLLEIEGRNVLFKVGCEAGTYIRKLVHDFGIELGTKAHMQELVRTKVGMFNDKNWISLHDLKDAYEFYKNGDESRIRKCILPIEDAVAHLKKVWVLDNVVGSLCYGSGLGVKGVSKLNEDIKKGEILAVMTLKNELICIGKATMNSEEMLVKERGNIISDVKVFMEREVYPYKNKQKDI
ncbi:RNA-guided pseudouridylation complex pseudouridine synthase subunit Cbf5 [Candidatus Woesearchaeota archaeon]|nr:RNA-guided pseudouridylation complex pseudouridine synthase subunit Cbf5 [Candidatus Woesearchaeota archaeon]